VTGVQRTNPVRDDLIILADFNPGETAASSPLTGAPAAVAFVPAAAPGQYRALPFVAELRACQACPARQEARQVVVGDGPADAVGMVLGQNPGGEEDVSGLPFVGAGGDLLNEWLTRLGLDRRKLVVTNAVKCHTYNNRVPRTSELKACYEHTVSKELEVLTALQVIFPVGKPAVSILLGKAAPPMTPLMAHHFLVRATSHGGSRDLHVFPLPHPAFLLRARHLTELMHVVLTQVRRTLEQEVPEAYAQMKVT
jgi:uracil-DNA glycosylase family 4